MATRLNIGCGRDYRTGWLNLDMSQEVKTDLLLDIRTDDLPYESNSVDEIYISGVLEQVLMNEHLLHAMNEMHRVLKVDAFAVVIVPSSKFSTAFRDPQDCRHFTEETFAYFDKSTAVYHNYGSVYGYAGWSKIEQSTNKQGIITARLFK